MTPSPSDGPGPGEPLLGAEFAGHRLEAVIGRGGMGLVYRARNLALDQDRALKVLTAALSSDDRFRDRFRRESRLAASIDHPNVIPIHQAGEEAGHLFLAMRLVEGVNLRQLVARDGPLDPDRASVIVAAAAAGLEAAHAAGLVHRDVKPANVLVGEGRDGGRVYIADFGISRSLTQGETMTATGELIGTADFMAPEQIAGDPVDRRADVYALGAVLYFALTGQAPFPRDNEIATLFAHANAARPRPSAVATAVSPALDAIVERAMAVAPDDRYPSAAGLEAALEGAPAPPTAQTKVLRRPHRRFPAVPLAVVLTVVAAALLAVVLAGGGDEEEPTDAPRAKVASVIELGTPATALAVGDERVWVALHDQGEVVGIDRQDEARDGQVAVPGAKSVAVGFGSVWAISGSERALYRLDPLEGGEGTSLKIPLPEGAAPSDVAVDAQWVWVADAGLKSVLRINPLTDSLDDSEELGTEPRSIATGGGSVWVTNINEGSVSEIDPETVKREGSEIDVGRLPNNVTVGEGAVWVTSGLDGDVYEIDPEESPPEAVAIAAGDRPRGVAAGLGSVWVALAGSDSVARVDPDDRAVVGDPIPVGDDPSDIAVADDAVWVSSEGDGSVTRITP